MNKELIQTIFNIGVFVGRDMERDFVKNYDQLQREYVNFIDWEAERMLEVLNQLKIEERTLDLEERRKMVTQEMYNEQYTGGGPETLSHSECDRWKIPTKIITITYKGEKKEIYE